MSQLDKQLIAALAKEAPSRVETICKQLTLAFAGVYIVSTTLTKPPLLVWETDKAYFARYYVHVSSLHPTVYEKLQPSQGSSVEASSKTASKKAEVSITKVDTVQVEDEGEGALVELLTIVSRSTTWVRFLQGPFKDYIRFERNEIDQWFEDGRIFGGIRNPYKRIETAPVSRHIVVKVDGEEVAETHVAVLLNETYLQPAYYLPATSVKDWGAVTKSDHRTECPYKGEAWYLNLSIDGKQYDNLIWYYQYPTYESTGVQGYISFYKKDTVEIFVDGVRI